MSKAYLLAICLLATTLTGCLADDNETTEQKISPVGDEGDQNGGNVTTYSPESNITIRYDSQNYFANFSKSGNTVHVNFSGESFTAFIWFYDYEKPNPDWNEELLNWLYSCNFWSVVDNKLEVNIPGTNVTISTEEYF